MSLSAPVVLAERLLSLSGYDTKTFWSPTPVDEHFGVGAAVVLVASGETRFEQIRDSAESLFRGLGVAR